MRCLTGVLMAARVKLPMRTLGTDLDGCADGQPVESGSFATGRREGARTGQEATRQNTSAQTSLAGVTDCGILCGKSDPEWSQFYELAERHCIRAAGHDGPHIAQRDDETHQQTVDRSRRLREVH